MRALTRRHSLIISLLVVFVAGFDVHAENTKKIQEAVDRGVKYLKSANIGFDMHAVGKSALLGLTLLECGLPADDDAVARAAATVRDAGPMLTHTYTLSLAIMFLDRLGDPLDVPLIQAMGVRLAAGQNSSGGWGYECPGVEDDEVRWLANARQELNELRAQNKLPPNPRKERPKLPKELTERMARLAQQRQPAQFDKVFGQDDNSNTQFAILGLWIARRHGVPVEKSLGFVEQRFKRTQNADGGWGYHAGGFMTLTTPAMTCAGLLGLAMAYGSANEAELRAALPGEAKRTARPATPRNFGRDPAVLAGLNCLSTAIGVPGVKVGVLPRDQGGKLYYFLWSLERVGVSYDLKTIGRKDWYGWGSDVLLQLQSDDGSWAGEYGGIVDTSFALLFLKRANLASDLTASLKGRVKDPGEVTLRAGVGGEAVPKVERGDTPSNDAPMDDEAARLKKELLDAPADRRDEMLERYKDAKGVAYTQALVSAIPQLPVMSKGKARDALAERLMRMTATTLRERLRDKDPEMRVAAARAAPARKTSPTYRTSFLCSKTARRW